MKIAVAMSGGVDSAVTAGLLAEAGFEVVGITLKLYDLGETAARRGACCAGVDIEDAARAAETIGIPHFVLDYETRFREAVIDDFADAYARGETPIPCVRCNETVKFADLLGTARDIGAAALATGHYVRRVATEDGPQLLRGVDSSRDQSYFLYRTTPEQLSFLRFPLGSLTKSETRAHAERLGLTLADKPDSQDICFVPTGSYADTVERLRPETAHSGEIVDEAGAVLATHRGISRFTVGQRRGLDIGGTPEPLFVLRLEPESRRVIVGPRSRLERSIVELRDTVWLTADPTEKTVTVKLRSSQPPIAARIEITGINRARIHLSIPDSCGCTRSGLCLLRRRSSPGRRRHRRVERERRLTG